VIYRSNLTCPDLYPAFAPRVECKPRHNSLGHDVLSDPAREPECGFLTHDEAAILYNVALRFRGPLDSLWLVIGGAAGWSAFHLSAAACNVVALDPLYRDFEMMSRARANVGSAHVIFCYESSDEYLAAHKCDPPFQGVLIDGDHSAPQPLNDAKNAAANLSECGVIVLHDVLGGPVQEAVIWLLDNGFKARIYWTPHVMAVCWRGEFTPPDHVPDPQIEPKLRPQMAGFPFERCE